MILVKYSSYNWQTELLHMQHKDIVGPTVSSHTWQIGLLHMQHIDIVGPSSLCFSWQAEIVIIRITFPTQYLVDGTVTYATVVIFTVHST